MSERILEPGKQANNGVLGGLGFFSGLLLCGVALVAQAALLHAVGSAVKKTT